MREAWDRGLQATRRPALRPDPRRRLDAAARSVQVGREEGRRRRDPDADLPPKSWGPHSPQLRRRRDRRDRRLLRGDRPVLPASSRALGRTRARAPEARPDAEQPGRRGALGTRLRARSYT